MTTAGRFLGGISIAVPGWLDTARDFEVAGWSASLGHDFNPAWLTGSGFVNSGFFGISGIGTGIASDFNSGGIPSSINIFGGATGIQNGFNLFPTTFLPEPSSLSLSALGSVALLIFGRRRPQ